MTVMKPDSNMMRDAARQGTTRRRGRAGLILIVAALLFGGCMTLEEMAPPVSDLRLSQSRGADAQQLNRGRDVYLTQCSRCHNIEPIGRYSRQEWETILPRMNKKARLASAQAEDLAAYLFAARQFLDRPPETGP